MAVEIDQKIVMRNGLRILAHMIARAYLRDMKPGQSDPVNLGKKEKEVTDANKRSKRGYETSPPGKDKAGDKEEER